MPDFAFVLTPATGATPTTLAVPLGTVTTFATIGSAVLPTGVSAGTPFDPVDAGLAKYTLLRHFVGDYYFRIWVTPPHLVILSPRLGVPYYFAVWNAYPWNNTWATLGGAGQTGLTLDLAQPLLFREIEEKTFAITIGGTAPATVYATFIFNFTEGSGTLLFETQLSRILNLLAEAGVMETWAWLTDLIQAYNSTEQRIALRDSPRRSAEQNIVLEGDTDRRILYDRMYMALTSNVIVPYLPYMSFLTQAAGIGANRLYFDPKYTDLRVGELAALINPQTEDVEIVTVQTLEADGATLAATLGVAASVGWGIVPAFTSRIANLTGPQMRAITGQFQAKTEVVVPRSLFSRPGSLATITTFDSFNVLDRRPLANNTVDEGLDSGYEVIDNLTGMSRLLADWPHAFVSGKRQFLINRYDTPAEMDFWRDFLYAARGQQNPFLMPTFRHDLTKFANPSQGGVTLIVNEGNYPAYYFPHQTYKRLEILTGAGTIRRKVSSAVKNVDGTSTLTLTAGFPSTPEGVDIQRISFLNLVRLNADQVTLDHGHRSSTIEFAVRTIDA
jgi:hypothetical protein